MTHVEITSNLRAITSALGSAGCSRDYPDGWVAWYNFRGTDGRPWTLTHGTRKSGDLSYSTPDAASRKHTHSMR